MLLPFMAKINHSTSLNGALGTLYRRIETGMHHFAVLDSELLLCRRRSNVHEWYLYVGISGLSLFLGELKLLSFFRQLRRTNDAVGKAEPAHLLEPLFSPRKKS